MEIVILLTKHYPYGAGEEFIENEIDFISAQFERVIVVATSVSDSMELTRRVPNGVQVIKIKEIQKTEIRYARYIFSSIRYNGDLLLQQELSVVKELCQKLAIRYQYTRAKRIEHNMYRAMLGLLGKDDCVTWYSYWFGDLSLAACFLDERIQTRMSKLVSRAHRYDLYPERNMARIVPFTQYLLKKLSHVYPCSIHGTNYLKRTYGELAKNVCTAYLGTNDYGFYETSSEMTFNIITCSGITTVKRLFLLAGALSQLDQMSPVQIVWTCVGDGPLLSKLKLFTQSKLKNISVVYKGRLSNKDVIALYQRETFHVFINTSEDEGLPVAIMEAQSFGIPTIATDVGGTSEIVLNQKTGILLTADPTEVDIAHAILSVMTMPQDVYLRMRQMSRKHWEDNFNAEKNYRFFTQEIAKQ